MEGLQTYKVRGLIEKMRMGQALCCDIANELNDMKLHKGFDDRLKHIFAIMGQVIDDAEMTDDDWESLRQLKEQVRKEKIRKEAENAGI